MTLVQSSMSEILHGNHESYGILRKTMRGHIKKKKLDRPAFSSHLFIDAKPRTYTLTKEVLPIVCHAIFSHTFEYNPNSKKFETDYTIDPELKAIWTACGSDIINIIEGRFTADFTAGYSNRWGDFASDESIWAQCARSALKTVRHQKTLGSVLRHHLFKRWETHQKLSLACLP